MGEKMIKTKSFGTIPGQILVLGSRATLQSLRRGLYYTSDKSGNIIWEVLDAAFPDGKTTFRELQSQYIDLFDRGEDVSSVKRMILGRLGEVGVGFSDVLFECESSSSRDNDIKNAVINPNLMDVCASASIVLLNGKTAAKFFEREAKKWEQKVNYRIMPSTSNMQGRYVKSKQERIKEWVSTLLSARTESEKR